MPDAVLPGGFGLAATLARRAVIRERLLVPVLGRHTSGRSICRARCDGLMELQCFSGGFHPASREIRQERRPT